jgi:hypothetical protein
VHPALAHEMRGTLLRRATRQRTQKQSRGLSVHWLIVHHSRLPIFSPSVVVAQAKSRDCVSYERVRRAHGERYHSSLIELRDEGQECRVFTPEFWAKRDVPVDQTGPRDD